MIGAKNQFPEQLSVGSKDELVIEEGEIDRPMTPANEEEEAKQGHSNP